jgi:aminoglycoside phosphotransferase (APT) family kinase protein
MQVPLEQRRRPPPAALEWVARSVGAGARVTRVRRLRNSWAAAMHAVDVDDGRGNRHALVLRRWARTDFPPDIGVVENEAAALGLVGRAEVRVPAPRLVAADPRGEHADVPAVVMTRLGGLATLAPRDLDGFIDGLAATLRAVHATDVPPGVLGYFRPWIETVTTPPAWSQRPDVWARAIAVAHRDVPPYTPVLCHRDFHPGNILWTRARVTGVVDWSHSCRGPAAVDVAHCRMNLALLFGQDAGDELARRYGPVDDLPWHDIADAVSTGDGDPPEVWRWHDAGRTDITSAHIIVARDEFLARALSRLG